MTHSAARITPQRSLLPIWKLLVISLFGFSIGMVSNTLEPAVIGQRAIELAPPNARNTAVGLVTFSGLMIAVVVQPVIGAFSDGTRSRWGRRRPYLVGGTLLVILSLYLIALTTSIPIVAVGILLLYVASNLVQVPGQALVPDHVPAAQHGRAAGFKAMFELLAFIIGRLVSGELVARGHTAWAVTVPAVVFLVSLILILQTIPDPPVLTEVRGPVPVKHVLQNAFAFHIRRQPVFGWWFANRILFWCGFIALQTFLLFFIIDVIGLAPPHAQQFVGRLSTAIGVAVLGVTLLAGWLSDRLGRRGMIVLSGLVAGLSALGFLFARELNVIAIVATAFGIGVGIFLSANWALLTDIVPRGETARYLGLANIASAAGSGIARLLGALLIDPLNLLTGTTALGYLTTYSLAGLLLLGSAAVAWRMPLPETTPR